MPKKNNYIYHHLGLGDHIICNGLVREICQKDENFYLFVKSQNIENIKFMFRDITNLKMIEVTNDVEVLNYIQKYPKPLIKIGHEKLEFIKNFYSCKWDEAFYKQIDVDFEKRWSSFYFERDNQMEDELYTLLNPNNEEYCLIHNKDSQGVDRINYEKIRENLKLIFLDKIPNYLLFHYVKLIENAKEIHCIDSSFKHLVDSVETESELFYHKNYIQRYSEANEHTHKKNWIII